MNQRPKTIEELSQERRFPRLGKIKIGIKVTAKNKKGEDIEIPKSIDYFRATGRYANLFHKVYGEKPSVIDIVFPLDDIKNILSFYYRSYKSGGLWCFGDGVIANRVNDEGKLAERDCPCEILEKGDCSENLRITFLLPKVPVIGVWQLQTKSINTRLNSFSQLDIVRAMGKRIAGIPMSMSVQFEKGALVGSKTKFPVVTITPQVNLQDLIEIGKKDLTAGETFRQLMEKEPIQLESLKEEKRLPKSKTEFQRKEEDWPPDLKEMSLNDKVGEWFPKAEDKYKNLTLLIMMEKHRNVLKIWYRKHDEAETIMQKMGALKKASKANEEIVDDLEKVEPSQEPTEEPLTELPEGDYPRHTNFTLMKEWRAVKELIEEKEYREILDEQGIKHSNQKKALNKREIIEAVFHSILDQRGKDAFGEGENLEQFKKYGLIGKVSSLQAIKKK